MHNSEPTSTTTFSTTISTGTTSETTITSLSTSGSTSPEDPYFDEIDVKEDMKEDEGWTVNCNTGYELNWEDFNCPGSGKINIPDVRDEKGYWTQCTFPCRILYTVAEGYSRLNVSVYQKNRWIQICVNDEECQFNSNQGWQNYFADVTKGDVSTFEFKAARLETNLTNYCYSLRRHSPLK